MARKLTAKQEVYKNTRISGIDPSAAYDIAYPTHKMNRNAVNVAAQKLERHPIISLLIKESREKAVERALVTVEDVVRGLLLEAKGDGEDTTTGGRTAAWKALAEYTGGFDANVAKNKTQLVDEEGKDLKWVVEIITPDSK